MASLERGGGGGAGLAGLGGRPELTAWARTGWEVRFATALSCHLDHQDEAASTLTASSGGAEITLATAGSWRLGTPLLVLMRSVPRA